MKLLLSAYSCEPYKGSEPGVGWHWAIELAKMGHDVWVITRANNQPVIENALSDSSLANLHFVYYDLPAWVRKLKKGPGGIYFYYFFWQWGAYQVARSLAQKVQFDWVHHITFGVFRQPSFMAFLGIPCILGPLGGGERTPHALRQEFPIRGYILDLLRDWSNRLAALDPIAHASYQRSTIILCKTQETLSCIPNQYHEKCRIYLEIGIDSLPVSATDIQNQRRNSNHLFRVLYVGRLIYWKGLHLGLEAFAQFHEEMPESRLTVVGSGSDSNWLHQLAEQLDIDHAIDWIPWMEQKDVMQAYSEHDIFLFPSLHDSSGNVILESLAQGLPVICLDLGGPGVMVNESCGRIVKTAGLNKKAVTQALTEQLKNLSSHPDLLAQLGHGAFERAREYRWDERVSGLYESISDSQPLKAACR